MMVYGVDLPTEIAYAYRISDSKDPGPPILDEIFYEEPSRKGKDVEKKGYDTCPVGGEGQTVDGEENGFCVDDPSNKEDNLGAWNDLIEKMDSERTGASTGEVEVENESDGVSNIRKSKANAVTVSKSDDKKTKLDSSESSKSSFRSKKDMRIEKRHEKVEKIYNNEVFAVKSKKASFSQSQRRFVRSEKQVHSGDNTVPYVSLSAAHRWLEDDSGGREEDNKRWVENRPEIIHKNIFDSWATLKMASTVTTVDPAVEMFHSIRGNGDTTIVMELAGVDHLDVAKHPYVHFLMFENLLVKMSQDLCLNGTNAACEKEFEAEKSKKSFFRFPNGGPDVQLFGRQLTAKAGQALDAMKERYNQP